MADRGVRRGIQCVKIVTIFDKMDQLTNSIEYSTIRREKTLPTVDKIIERMKQQPNGIRAVDAEKVLKAFVYEAG